MSRLREADAARRLELGGRDYVEALARGLSVVQAFGSERRPLSLSDLARTTGLPKASVRRMLHTLITLKLAESDGRNFHLTPRVLDLAGCYLGSNRVSTVVQPVCERIAAATGRSCFVATLQGHDMVVIAHALPNYPMDLAPSIGLRHPAFCTAAGRAILSTFDDAALDAWLADLKPVALTKFTPTSPREIHKTILEARERGYGSTDQEVKIGDRALAVPLKRQDGRTIGALNVTNSVEDSPPTRHLALLKSEAAALQSQLF
ncbi:MAG TPA: IclR family transcriptional regulator C-terminal domain-containing protein [Reyranella sp.]|nr:IclR family transcriptional regulator C-terminal domain-containing protein [Reyranella sp.]